MNNTEALVSPNNRGNPPGYQKVVENVPVGDKGGNDNGKLNAKKVGTIGSKIQGKYVSPANGILPNPVTDSTE